MRISALNQFEIDKIYQYGNLKPQERLFFDLRNDEYTYEEIAEELDVSVRTVKRIAKRVYSKCIRTLLHDYT
jgi:RNA polymerase sigma factor (sigma-70 family)